MLGQNSGVPDTKIGNICLQTVFDVQSSRSPDLSPLHIFLWGHLKFIAHSAAIENKETRHQRTFMRVKPFASAPGPLKGSDST
jgi:hypothetical protein